MKASVSQYAFIRRKLATSGAWRLSYGSLAASAAMIAGSVRKQ